MKAIEAELPLQLSHETAIRLAVQVEAGLYATWLLTRPTEHPKHLLELLSRRGKQAWEQLWAANLRLVAKLAHQTAQRHGLPYDELFQEGCLGLATALMRFDYQRGHRLSTLAHEYVKYRLVAAATSRLGQEGGSRNSIRVRFQLRQLQAQEATRERPLSELAHQLGVSPAMVRHCQTGCVSLDEVSPAQLATNDDFDKIDSPGTDFLDLLGPSGEFLKLRFGVGCRSHSRSEVATRIGISLSTAARLEARALREAKRMLQQEFCRLPAGGQLVEAGLA